MFLALSARLNFLLNLIASLGKLRELWIIPIFFVFVTGVSMAVAYVLGWIFRLKRSQRYVFHIYYSSHVLNCFRILSPICWVE